MSDSEPLLFEDLRSLSSSGADSLRAVASSRIESFLSTNSAEKRQQLAEEVAQLAAVASVDGARALRCLAFLSRAASGTGDGQAEAQSFLEALQTLAREERHPPLDDAEAERLRTLFVDLAKRREQIRKSLSELRAKRGVLPMFEEIQGTVEMRAVRNVSPDSSSVEFAGVVPIVSARIKCDVGSPNHFFFQLSEEGMDELIDGFEQLRKEMHALRDCVKID